MKRTILMLTVVSLIAVPAFAAKKAPGILGPPELLSITQTTATIDEVPDVDVFLLDWTDVTGADKYSVDVTAMALADTGEVDEDENPILIELEMSASFGTSERLDGGDMSDSNLNIPVEDIEALVADLQAYIDYLIGEGDIVSADPIEVSAKVKALDPSVKPTKRQNNPFSNSLPIVLP
jgi:hypothetical protein